MKKLNEIDGFNPMEYARHIQDSNGNDCLYLDVQYRKLWFRLANPNGKIVKSIKTFDGNIAVVEARVYLDKNDAADCFVSNAFAQRSFDGNNADYGTRYLESAETAAVGRALADAGYGLQFCLEQDTTPVDAGQQTTLTVQQPVSQQQNVVPQSQAVQSVQPMPQTQPIVQSAPTRVQQPVQYVQSAQQVQPTQPMRQPVTHQNVQQSQTVQPVQYAQPVQTQYAPQQYVNNRVQQIQSQPVVQAQTFTAQTPLDVVVANMTYEQAVKVVYHCNSAKFNGKTLGELSLNGLDQINWIINNYPDGKNNIVKGAAIIISNRKNGLN